MVDHSGDFVARRERLALRAIIGARPGEAGNPSNNSATMTELDFGNYVGIRVGATVWVSATPVSSGATGATALGATLALRARKPDEVSCINILDATAPGITARRASYFSIPLNVYRPDGIERVAPQSHAPRESARADHLVLADLFRRAGADVVIEHGVVTAEVNGLEVARVIDEDGSPTVRIGVGTHDREMFKMLNGAAATVDQLRSVVDVVRQHRRADAPNHPLNLLAPERALRARVIDDPRLVGVRSLEPAEPPTPRANVKDSVPCCAIGEDADGVVVAVFVAGVDLDAVPIAADARSRLAPDARLLIVAAARNVVPLQVGIASMLTKPAEFVSA